MRINRGFIGGLRERLLTVKFLIPALILLLIFVTVGSVIIVKDRANAATCPCTVFTVDPTPGTFAQPGGIELGFKFKSSIDGYISGIRFFKTSNMGGTHTASLWNNQGTRITQATFDSETATGWQEVNFSPVAITADTIYTASVFMTDGQYNADSGYFTSDVTNENLTAPRNGAAHDANGVGGQGVYNDSGSSVYPTSSFNSANYWIDVSFVGSTSNDPPVVNAQTPAADATDVNLGETVSATFDQAMDVPSISGSTFTVKDSSNNPVTGTVSYDTATKKASFVTPEGFTPGETYTATLEGGTGTVIQSLNGVALASDYSWSFTARGDDPCPCTLKGGANPAGAQTFDEAIAGVELGVKVVPEGNGYIQSLRFYKPIISDQTTHTGSIWDKNGNQLATVTFTNESEYGWQEAKLSTPLRVYEGQPYILSYGATEGVYMSLIGGLNSTFSSDGLTAHATGDTRNAATGSGNGNGVYSTTQGSYPSSASTNASYYWIDATFTNDQNRELPLEVIVSQPTGGSYGVPRSVVPSVTFNRAIDGSTVNNVSVQLLHGGTPVAGVSSYDAAKRSVIFTPASPLGYEQKYTLRLAGTVADINGVDLGTPYEVEFTIGSEHTAGVTEGMGGPILVVTSAADPYGQYYSEILRTEGITYFDVKDISEISAAVLSSYQTLILAEMSLSQPQTDTITAWVNSGGNLVAMRPDKKLAGLLGLADANSTRVNQYFKIDTTTAPGTGITSDSMQFKGTADNYTLSGAASVADLYSDTSTATSNPAVTYRAVGSQGGTAAAFTYDLAKSVIAQHQGNKAWTATERDGIAPVRTNDLFYGAKTGDIQPDWTDMNKIHIPQADEQQRLLVNVMTKAMKDKTPMPRFWYLPHDNKAAVVLAGDDHGLPDTVGTQAVMNNWLNESVSSCSTEDWQCVRASHYIYATSALSNARAVQYDSYNFEIGLHPLEACGNFATYAPLSAQYTDDLNGWRAKYTGLQDARSTRIHCYAWSGWDFATQYEQANGIRYDLNYAAYPAAWINGRSPLLTGSGMNMRLTLDNGSMADVRQGVTNFDNTAAPIASVNATLDNAIGASGYYGIFGTHYDMTDSYDRLLFDAAKARNIPLITAEQATDWLDGREHSQFSSLQGSTGEVTFTLKAAEKADGLKAMMPMENEGGTLSTLKRAGASVSYQTQTIKGVSYAVFNAEPGDYEVRYSNYALPGGETPNSGGSQPGSGETSPRGSSNGIRNGSSQGSTDGQSGEIAVNETDSTKGQGPDSSAQSEAESAEDENRTNETSAEEPVNWLLVIGVPLAIAALLGAAIWWRRHNNAV